jgi:Ca2+-binding RTX toxin-like protein
MGRAALFTIVAMLIATPQAHAGTASVDGGVLRFVAAPGETNDITVTAAGGLTDATGPPVTAGANCVPAGNGVQCAGVTRIALELGDQADRVRPLAAAISMQANGGDGNDTLEGSDITDELDGGQGSDTIDGRGGADTIEAGPGCADQEQLTGGDGFDTLRFSRAAQVDGGADDDTFVQVTVNCPPAASTVSGGAGVDTADFSSITRANLTVSLDDIADDGPDGINNFRQDIENLLAGNAGWVLIGNAGPNVIRGGLGDDVLAGRGGTDTLRGSLGEDTADYSTHTAALSLTLDGQANDGAAGENDLIDDEVEHLWGGSGDDTLVGDGFDNNLDGGPGADAIRGGAGTDTVDYSVRTAAVAVDLDGSAGDDGEAGEGDTVDADVEGVAGGDGNDVLTGNAGSGFLVGGDGDDQITDRGGADIISAGAGADSIDSVDGETDGVNCGAGTDQVRADAVDAFSDDCEATDTGPEPGPNPNPAPPGQNPPPPGPSVPTADRLAPVATVRLSSRLRSRVMRSRGVTLTINCNELCRVSVELKATSATRRTLVRRRVRGASGVMARGSLRLGGPATRRLNLKLTAAGAKALRRVPTGRYTLTVKVSDSAGNERTITRALRFTR